MRALARALAAAFVLAASPSALAGTLAVGPGKTYPAPCAAIAAAADGDVIEIDAGTYKNDVCAIKKNGLTLRGVGGRAKLDVTGFSISNGKGIWVVQGNDTTVENIEFAGASVPDQNGAGIRQEGANLTVRGSYFHDNEDGILAGDNMASEILVETSEFARNGFGDGYSHNMYVNHVKRFTLRFSYSHGTPEGHLVKSRALETFILYNRLTDEPGTTASYELNLPNGGKAFVIGNLIEQGPDTHNPSIVTFGEEGTFDEDHPVRESALYFVNNTVVNDRPQGGTFVNVAAAVTTPAVLRNNVFVGAGTICSQASAVLDHNFTMGDPKLAGAASFDYHLLPGSPCVDMGADPGKGEGEDLAPHYHYVHPAGYEARASVGTIDIGAYELGGGGGAGGGGAGGGMASSSSSSGMASSSSGMASSSSGGTTGGDGGSGGAGGDGGGGASAGDEGGCGCRAGGGGEGSAPVIAAALAGLVALRRRRARR